MRRVGLNLAKGGETSEAGIILSEVWGRMCLEVNCFETSSQNSPFEVGVEVGLKFVLVKARAKDKEKFLNKVKSKLKREINFFV